MKRKTAPQFEFTTTAEAFNLSGQTGHDPERLKADATRAQETAAEAKQYDQTHQTELDV